MYICFPINKRILLLFNSKIFRALFLLVFLVNLFFIHVVFQQYVLCYESDGRIVIEKLNSDECGTDNLATLTGIFQDSSKEHCDVCTDFSATEKFGSDKSQSLKIKQVQQPLAALAILPESFISLNCENSSSKTEILLTSLPLEAYKTVSLLI
jgi:hypothetical protein